jgi:prepilin signal peptidase PulO-like enzyme (type II secretory pathway)
MKTAALFSGKKLPVSSPLFNPPMWWFYIANSTLLITAALIDLRWRRIPHWLTISGCVLALAGRGMISAEALISGVLGLLLAFTFFLVIYLLARSYYNKNGMGFGDVMLAAMIGALFGPIMGLWVLAIGLLLAGFYALNCVWRGQAQRHTLIPFGPFLVFPALVGLWIVGL